MRKIRWVALLALLPGMALARPGEPRFSAVADRTRLFVGERLTITITLQGPDVEYQGPFPAPDMEPYLRRVGQSGPQTSQNMQIINGRISRSGTISMNYTYQAYQAGRVTVPAINYRIGGVLVSTRPLQIEVMEPSSPSLLPGGTGWQPPSDPYLELRVDKKQAYVGEQITASWNIYFHKPFNRPSLVQVPAASDFMVADLGTVSQLNPVTKTIRGRRWHVAYVKSMAFFPIKTGEAVIEPLVMGYAVQSNARSFFGQPMFENRQVESKPVKIKVLPLPEKGKPADFSGAVGRFKISLDPATGSVKANEQFKFTMTVQGSAHPDFIPKPKAELPPGFELYTAQVDKSTGQERGKATGVRRFKMILVAHQPGRYTLPPFQFSYFDPAAKKYAVVKSQELLLRVAPGKAGPEPVAAGPEQPLTLIATGKDLRYIKPDREDLENQGGWIMARPGLAALQMLPLLAVAAAFGLRKRREKLSRDLAYARRLRAAKRSRKSLEAAGKAARAGDAAGAFLHAARALSGYIADRANLADQGMTSADALASLRRAGAAAEIVNEAEAVLAECDRACYAPGTISAESARLLIERTAALIRKLEKENGK